MARSGSLIAVLDKPRNVSCCAANGVGRKADIVKVEVPGAIAADIRRRGMPATRNSTCVIGTPTMRNRLTPP